MNDEPRGGRLTGDRLAARLARDPLEGGIVLTPILDVKRQVTSATVDLRLGTEFLVALRTRTPTFDTRAATGDPATETFYERTFRDFDEAFTLYPRQFVLGCSFEYIRLPNDVTAVIHARSSLSRAGLRLIGMLQPGYTGVVTFELVNDGVSTLSLYPGMRLAQLAFEEVGRPVSDSYLSEGAAKYVGAVGPQLSAIRSEHDDWTQITRMRKRSGAPPAAE